MKKYFFALGILSVAGVQSMPVMAADFASLCQSDHHGTVTTAGLIESYGTVWHADDPHGKPLSVNEFVVVKLHGATYWTLLAHEHPTLVNDLRAFYIAGKKVSACVSGDQLLAVESGVAP